MAPVKKHMVQGYLVPTVRGTVSRFISKQRRITIEIYRPAEEEEKMESTHTSGDVSSVQAEMFNQLLKGVSSSGIGEEEPLDDDDVVVMRILKPSRDKDDDDDIFLGSDLGKLSW